jgi:type IV pilus assembly protein PilC
MPIFSYQATDKKAREVSGVVEAETLAIAVNQVRKMGYFPTKVREDAGVFARRLKLGKTHLQGSAWGRVKRKQIMLMTRQLATLIDSGLPLLRSLYILHHQEKPGKLKSILDQMMGEIRGGSTFSDALARHPKVFDKLYVNMIRAGELGGMLEVVLNRLADFAERSQMLARKTKEAMAYPAMVMMVAAVIVTFMLVYIVPVFHEIFAEFDRPLPAPTLFLINISDALRHSAWKIFVWSAGAILAFRLLARFMLVRHIKDRVALKVPVVGQLITKISVARFARTLGTLITSGVPILQSLSIVKETIGNRVVADAVGCVHDSIREGESIASPLEESGVFPFMVVNMIDVGEETGHLDSMLLKVADIYDAEVESTIGAMLKMLEPAMVVVLGGIVGFIVVAMYLPIIGILPGV